MEKLMLALLVWTCRLFDVDSRNVDATRRKDAPHHRCITGRPQE